jgi:hypothetical protein
VLRKGSTSGIRCIAAFGYSLWQKKFDHFPVTDAGAAANYLLSPTTIPTDSV